MTLTIEEIKNTEHVFRALTPKELAEFLRQQATGTEIEEDAESVFTLTNLIRAADLLDPAA